MRRPPLISLSVKVGLVLFAVVAGALAIVYLAVVPRLENRLVDAKIDELEQAAPRVARQARDTEPELVLLQEMARQQAEEHGARVIVLERLTDDQLRNVADSREHSRQGDFSTDPNALEALGTQSTASGRVEHDGQPYAEAAAPAGDGLVVVVAAPLDDVLANVRVMRRSLVIAGAASLAVSWLVGYLLAWRFTRRIRRLEAAAERLADGDFETPIADGGRDEVGQLADAFDAMRIRLAVLDRARREFIANASHELRTPLFSLGGFVELLDDDEISPDVRRDFLAEMRDQIDRLTRLATDLLDLSRLDAGQLEVEIGPFDLATTGRLVADEFRAVAEAAGHELIGEADMTVEALGDELRVQQIVRALVENAIRHTPAGTAVVVRVVRRGGTAVLEVRDDGPGVPAPDQQHLFQRFYRAAGGKASGSGLGLAIASELALRLGGSIELSSRPGSTVFTLNLPPAEPGRAQETLVADVAS
jgi:signal transduction histidine kinase